MKIKVFIRPGSHLPCLKINHGCEIRQSDLNFASGQFIKILNLRMDRKGLVWYRILLLLGKFLPKSFWVGFEQMFDLS